MFGDDGRHRSDSTRCRTSDGRLAMLCTHLGAWPSAVQTIHNNLVLSWSRRTAKSFWGHKAEGVKGGDWTPLEGFGSGS